MIYLNNAATTYPKPDCVLRALSESAAAPPPALLRRGFSWSDVKPVLARYSGGAAEEDETEE